MRRIKDATMLRAGAVAGFGSCAVAVVFNAIHPRATSESLNDITELLRIVSASGSWRVVHLFSVVASLVGVAAILAVLRSMMLDSANRWPLVAAAMIVLTTPTLLLSVGLDGFAIKTVADQWAMAAGGNRDTLLAAATALRSVDIAVLNVVMIGHFGLVALALGVATWTSRLYAKWLGAIALASGALGLLCGTLQALSGKLTTFSYLILLTVSLALFTIWLTGASVLLWRNADKVVTS